MKHRTLPSVPAGADSETRNFLSALKESVESSLDDPSEGSKDRFARVATGADGGDGSLAYRRMPNSATSGNTNEGLGGSSSSSNGESNETTMTTAQIKAQAEATAKSYLASQFQVEQPNQPTQVDVEVRPSMFIVTWAVPQFKGYSGTEVYLQDTLMDPDGVTPIDPPSLDPTTQLAAVGTFNGVSISADHLVGYYIWVRHYNSEGLGSKYTGPYFAIGRASDDSIMKDWADGIQWEHLHEVLQFQLPRRAHDERITGAWTFENLKVEVLTGPDATGFEYPLLRPVASGDDWVMSNVEAFREFGTHHDSVIGFSHVGDTAVEFLSADIFPFLGSASSSINIRMSYEATEDFDLLTYVGGSLVNTLTVSKDEFQLDHKFLYTTDPVSTGASVITVEVRGTTATTDVRLLASDVSFRFNNTRESMDMIPPAEQDELNRNVEALMPKLAGEWQPYPYPKNALVTDGGYTGYSLVDDNEDRLRPVPIGTPEFDYNGTPNALTQFSGIVDVGTRVEATEGVLVLDVEVWPTSLSPTVRNTVVVAREVDGVLLETEYPLNNTTLTVQDWNSTAISGFTMSAGDIVEVYLRTQNIASTTQFSSSWIKARTYADAGTFEIDRERNLYISRYDNDTTDQTINLDALIVGATFSVLSQVSSAERIYRITSVETPVVDQYIFGIERLIDNGAPADDDLCTLSFDSPVADLTDYHTEVDHWLTQPDWANVAGVQRQDGVDQTLPNDAGGVRLSINRAYISNKWHIIATP